jgi:hypothetical protein
VKVPTGAFVARRNGKVFVTGNSGFPKSLDVSKAIDKAAGAEREVVGQYNLPSDSTSGHAGKPIHSHVAGSFPLAPTPNGRDITAPATDAARQWSGWGTALKPAWEPIIVARKPLGTPGTNVVAVVESALRRQGVVGEILWKPDDAKAAEKSRSTRTSYSTEQQKTAVTSAANAVERGTQSTDPLTATSTENGGISGPPRTQAGPENSLAQANENYATKCSTPTEARVLAVGSKNGTSSPSTTSTAGVQRTGELHTERSTGPSEEQDFLPTIESFAGIATGLTGSMAHVHIKRDSDGFFVWPAGLPRSAAGGSLTVAANVLKHGTGGINIDGCRIETADKLLIHTRGDSGKRDTRLTYSGGDFPLIMERKATAGQALGRWPANVILDEEAAALLDEQTGTLASGKAARGGHRRKDSMGATGGAALGGNADGSLRADENAGTLYGDSGGASRFFYTAKASRSERTHGGEVVNLHPTVKPISLMRYLVRLVTPPGGVVLDPFCGSGSTGVGAILEGFNFVGCERELASVETSRARFELAVLVSVGGVKNPWVDDLEVPPDEVEPPAVSSIEDLFGF